MFPALIIWGQNCTCWSTGQASPRVAELHRAAAGLSCAGYACGAKPARRLGNLGQSLEEQSWGWVGHSSVSVRAFPLGLRLTVSQDEKQISLQRSRACQSSCSDQVQEHPKRSCSALGGQAGEQRALTVGGARQ